MQNKFFAVLAFLALMAFVVFEDVLVPSGGSDDMVTERAPITPNWAPANSANLPMTSGLKGLNSRNYGKYQ